MGQTATKTTRLVLLCIVLTSCIGCDRVTKRIASEALKYSPPVSLLGDTVRLQYAENPGGFLGLGSGLPEEMRFLLLTILNGAFLAVLIWALLTRWNMEQMKFTACALILGGGLGNLIDRVGQNGMVIDFMNIGMGPIRTGIFNVADVAITAGVLGLLYAELKPRIKLPPPLDRSSPDFH